MSGVNEAAQRLSNALRAEEQPPTEAESVEAEKPEETQESAEVRENESETEEVAEVEESEREPTETEAEELYTVKVQGEEFQVSLDELRNGYMRGKDYETNTRKVREANEAASEKLQDLDERIEQASTLLDLKLEELNSPEMLQLKEDDPDAYLKKFDKAQSDYTKFQKLKQQRETERRKQWEEQVQQEQKLLTEVIPEWLDNEVMATETKSIAEYLTQDGLTPQEIQGIGVNHKLSKMARKAWLYDQLQRQDLSKKQVKAPPKAVKPASKSEKADRASSEAKALRDKLRKSGNVRDAARLLSLQE